MYEKKIPVMKTDGHEKEYRSNHHCHEDTYVGSKINPFKRLFDAIHKFVTTCITFFLVIFVCYSVFTFIMENGDQVVISAKQKFNLSQQQQQQLLSTRWERTKYRLNSIYMASTTPLPPIESKHYIIAAKRRKDKVGLGKKLLQNGDFIGAETLCKAEINNGNLPHEDHVNALVCLGEARIALHNAAWNSAFLESEHDLVYDRLHLAQKDFDAAVSLEPTYLGARLGLGLANFLIATREQPHSSPQLLFNSILHFEAIYVLASDTESSGRGEWITDDDINNMKISAMYNNGLAHLALGDIKSAISIFTKLSKLIAEDKYQSVLGISSVVTNLGAALLQRGATEQAINTINSPEVRKYCRIDGTKKNAIDHEIPYSKQRYLHKQCSILLNNLAIAEELVKENPHSKENGNETLMDLSVKYEKLLSLQLSSFASSNMNEREQNKKILSDGNYGGESIQSVDPENSTSPGIWLSSALEKLYSNNVDGALDVVTVALCLINESPNVNECKNTLYDALEQMRNQTKITSSQNNILLSNQITLLEQEILKLQSEIEYCRGDQETIGSVEFNETEVFLSSTGNEPAYSEKEIEQNMSREETENIEAIILENEIDLTVISVEKEELKSETQESESTETKLEIDQYNDELMLTSISVEPISSKEKNEEASSNVEVEQISNKVKEEAQAIEETPTMQESTHVPSRVQPNIMEPSDSSVEEEKDVQLPQLYNPIKKGVQDIDPSSLGYMKMADAYIQKENFKLASKQFLKVLKKTPNHIPAILGYATSMERYVKPKQFDEVAKAYANATIYALEQDKYNLAEAAFRRSLKLSEQIDGGGVRIDVLKYLATIIFNNDLGSEIYYELGLEYSKNDIPSQLEDALHAFKIAGAFSNTTTNIFHQKSLYQIAKLTFNVEGKLKKAMQLISSALKYDLEELQVDAYILSGKIKEKLLDLTGAIADYKKAISLPETNSSTSLAYYNLAVALKSQISASSGDNNNSNNSKTIEQYMETALNLGHDPTPEAIEVLGEHHIAIIKSAHRAEWRQYQESSLAGKMTNEARGGIMSSGLSSSSSIFAKADSTGVNSNSATEETLSMLEQGAASYDGYTVPSGDEIDGDASTTTATVLTSKQSASAKANY